MSTINPNIGFAIKNVKGKIPVTLPITTDDIPSSFPYTDSCGRIGPIAGKGNTYIPTSLWNVSQTKAVYSFVILFSNDK